MSIRFSRFFLIGIILALSSTALSWSHLLASGDAQSGSSVATATPTPMPPPSTGDQPDASNTGHNGSLLPYTGPSTITVDGTVLENFSYNGTLKIEADNVILRNFLIDTTGYYGIDAKYGAENLLIEDGEIVNTKSAAVIGSNFTARRLHIHNQGADHS